MSKHINKQQVYDYLSTIPKGKLSEQYAFVGMESQRKKLEADGIMVENNEVNLDKYKW